MSRNLCNGAICAFCHHIVRIIELPRPITREEARVYFEEYEGMLVANAECSDCAAPYLAWIDETTRKNGHFLCRQQARWEDGHLIPFDLSHRHSFNDEPCEKDFPRYRIEMVCLRHPWPKCEVCGGPMQTYGTSMVCFRGGSPCKEKKA